MTSLTRKTLLGYRAMAAALLCLVCSLGLALPLHANDAPAATHDGTRPSLPLTAEYIKLYGAQHKLSAVHIKLLETENANVVKNQKALANLEASLTPEQRRSRGSQQALETLQLRLRESMDRLSAHLENIERNEQEAKNKAATP